MHVVHLTARLRDCVPARLDREHARWLWSHLRRAFPHVLAVTLMPNHLHLVAVVDDVRAAHAAFTKILAALVRRLPWARPVWVWVWPPTNEWHRCSASNQPHRCGSTPVRPLFGLQPRTFGWFDREQHLHSSAMARLASLFTVFVTACTSDAPASATAAAPEHATAKECGPVQQEDLRRALVGTCTEPSTILVPPLATAMWEPAAELEPHGFQVVISPDGVALAGSMPAAWNEPDFRVRVRDELEKAGQMAEGKGETFTPRFVLAIDRNTPLSDIDPVLRALVAEKIDRGFLAFASGTRPRTSSPRHPVLYASALAELERQDPFARASFVANKLEPFALRCPALQQGFQNVATTDGPTRCETLMTEAAAAIVECGCPDFEPELVSWLQVLAGPADEAHLHVDAIELAPARAVPDGPGARAEPLEPNTTWAALVAERKAPFGTLWLELAE